VLNSFAPSAIDYLRFLPEIILTLTGVLIMFLEAILPDDKKHTLGLLALAGLVAALPAALEVNQGPAFQGMLLVDGMGTFFRSSW